MDAIYMHIRVPKKLHDTLLKEAKEQNITLNAYVNLILFKRKG